MKSELDQAVDTAFYRCRRSVTTINLSLFYPLILVGMLYGCSSNETRDNMVDSDKTTQPSAYKINIVNASNTIINDIRFKPCNSQTTQYLQLTDNLRPMEKFTINIYSQCVDLQARNAFKKKLVDVKNVDLQSVKTWTIR